jgi:hypothetical protein
MEAKTCFPHPGAPPSGPPTGQVKITWRISAMLKKIMIHEEMYNAIAMSTVCGQICADIRFLFPTFAIKNH